MRFFIISIIIFLISLDVNSHRIATFKIPFILENLQSYKDFVYELDKFKKKIFDELKVEEELLINRNQEIKDSKILLSESEYSAELYQFNERKKIFELKVNNLNNYLKENIELNENKILKEIIKIAKKIALEKDIDIVFADDQYFLSSDNIDISEYIYRELNNINILLQLSEYE